ncbi:hypothetical protein SAMN05421640_0900 [Ekhidna lutea]|uniref:Uncharacterized protein n=1 Tax=Ekhidna lutea TaxID=447679 RepID=A0A239GKZ5_EKHLU|nr:hypothetical protein SAMN05421640_0900 [Ekhidna lutea]
MSDKCISGKKCFESEELAEEALIQNHIRNNYRGGEGPVNVYQCDNCGYWHFTSKGDKSEKLRDPEVLEFIERERRAFDWERKLR